LPKTLFLKSWVTLFYLFKQKTWQTEKSCQRLNKIQWNKSKSKKGKPFKKKEWSLRKKPYFWKYVNKTKLYVSGINTSSFNI